MRKIIVAIDGYAATGKSSQAKRLAKFLGYKHIDSGAMYRAVTYYALKQTQKSQINAQLLIRSTREINISFAHTTEEQKTYLNGKDITKQIRKSNVTNQVSNVAKIPEIRNFLVTQQKEMGMDKGIIMDGRDIGTVVFPDAECKFFLNASPEVRAKRREIEQKENGNNEPFEVILKNIIHRDAIDKSREFSPLKKAFDAIEIEVSNYSIDEVFELLLSHILKKISI